MSSDFHSPHPKRARFKGAGTAIMGLGLMLGLVVAPLNSSPAWGSDPAAGNSRLLGEAVAISAIENDPPDNATARELWVMNGNAGDASGTGSFDDPYKNLNTALTNARPGDTIKLKEDITVTGAETSVVIDKAITIDGGDHTLRLRGHDIEIAADATLKNLNLAMLKDSGASGNIYLSGNSLTLDKVTTKISDVQTGQRPNIITGTKDARVSGPKAQLSIVNATDETRFKSITAGDLDADSPTPVVINLASSQIRVEDGINLTPPGGATTQTGSVDLTSQSSFVTTVHNLAKPNNAGERSVTFTGVALSGVTLDDVDNLSLTNGARITVSEADDELNIAKKISLDANTTLDLTDAVTKTAEVSGSGLVRIGDMASFESTTTDGAVSYEVYRGDMDYQAHIGKPYILTHNAALNPKVSLLPEGAPYRLVEDAEGTWRLEAIDTTAKIEPEATISLTENGQPRPFIDGAFTVTVAPAATNDPDATTGVPTTEVPVRADGTVDLGTWSFDTPGDYIFTITQVDTNGTGISYDLTPVEMTVRVEENQNDLSLSASASFTKNGANVAAINFANTYTAPANDADGDGISDASDTCANTPPGALVDANGCGVAPNLGQGTIVTGVKDSPITPVTVPITNPGKATPLRCEATGLPNGLSAALNPAGDACIISGTPSADTTANAPFTISMVYTRPDANGAEGSAQENGTVSITIPATPIDPNTPTKRDDDQDGVSDDVDACLGTPPGAAHDATGCSVAPTLTGSLDISGVKDTPFSTSVTINNPGLAQIDRCEATGLPAGLTVRLDASACIIEGTPSVDTGGDQPYTLTLHYTPADGNQTPADLVAIGIANITSAQPPAPSYDITGRVCEDLDGNGLCDAGDPDISGVTVELVDGSGTVINTAQTASPYTLTNVGAGNYTLRLAGTNPALAGYTLVSPATLNVSVVDANITGQDFAHQRTPVAPPVPDPDDRPGTDPTDPAQPDPKNPVSPSPIQYRKPPQQLPETGAAAGGALALGPLFLLATAAVIRRAKK